MPTLFGKDKDNDVLMNNLQLLQSKADKAILESPFHSTAADALEALGWFTFEKRRLFHLCLYVYKRVNEISARSMNLLANKDVHGYDTRPKDNSRLPHVRKNWGEQRTHYSVSTEAVTDWNSLDLRL